MVHCTEHSISEIDKLIIANNNTARLVCMATRAGKIKFLFLNLTRFR